MKSSGRNIEVGAADFTSKVIEPFGIEPADGHNTAVPSIYDPAFWTTVPVSEHDRIIRETLRREARLIGRRMRRSHRRFQVSYFLLKLRLAGLRLRSKMLCVAEQFRLYTHWYPR